LPKTARCRCKLRYVWNQYSRQTAWFWCDTNSRPLSH